MKRDIRVYIEDILIHEYFGVNLERVWKVIKEDISELKYKIQNIKSELDKSKNE